MKLEGKGIMKNMTLYNLKDYHPNFTYEGKYCSILEKKIKYHLNYFNEAQSELKH